MRLKHPHLLQKESDKQFWIEASLEMEALTPGLCFSADFATLLGMKTSKHPEERDLSCPVCAVGFTSLPVKRGIRPDDHSDIVEQHVCPNGHVYCTKIGETEMIL